MPIVINPTIANRLNNYTLKAATPTAMTAPVKVSLHDNDPGTTGANEITGGSYARQTAGYADASGGVSALAGPLTFAGMPAKTIRYIGLWDSAGTPLFILQASLATEQPVADGATFTLSAGTVSMLGGA